MQARLFLIMSMMRTNSITNRYRIREKEENKKDGVAICDSIRREQKPILINESGLYSLMLSGKDVAEVLGYTNPTKACRVHIEEDDRLMYKMDTSFGVKDTLLINESGLYSLILSSKLPDAKKFKRWVTSVALPKERSPRCLRMASVRMGGSWQQRYA